MESEFCLLVSPGEPAEAGGGDVKKYNCVHHIGGVASIVEHLYRVHVLAFEVLQIMEGGHKQLLK